ncbi:MAG: cytotoxic translational repressor of toxin-antitoxin stability system [Deltaproteobacteria bacterium]|nr:cytotoxic translational repressor of toxin-antitoxin stability system [Deltaproteobacteria bacterium]
MKWTVTISREAGKQIAKLPQMVRDSLIALIKEIEVNGPVRGNWPNYGALTGSRYHCHLKKGRPTYVAVWELKNKKDRFVEVVYAGTHEKAPYQKH